MNIKNNKNCKITINDKEISVSEKEKTADAMFEELGYKKFYSINNVDNVPNNICYRTDEFEIKFNMIYEAVDFEKKKAYYSSITMQELQAVNKKAEELGWIK